MIFLLAFHLSASAQSNRWTKMLLSSDPETTPAEQTPDAASTPAVQPHESTPIPDGLGLNREKMRHLTGADTEAPFPKSDTLIRHQPRQFDQHRGTLIIENLQVRDVLNQRAIDIALSNPEQKTQAGEILTFGRIVLRNCEIAHLRRDTLGEAHGLNLAFIRIHGAEDAQHVETEVLLEDLFLHDGNAVPLLIQNGKFSTITFRRVKFQQAGTNTAQILLSSGAAAKQIVIEDSPGLRINLMGPPNSVAQCMVRNSPGAEIIDGQGAAGRTGAKVVREDDQVTPIAAAIVRDPTDNAVPAAKKQTDAAVAPRLITELSKNGAILARLENINAEQLAFIQFEAFDELNYRYGSPVIITQAPWQAELPAGTRDRVRITATITRLGGNPEKPLITIVERPR